MPIDGLTTRLRMPRLGKIHLGLPMESRTYPQPTDYFVCPEEVVKALGDDKPKSLTILFPTEEPEQFASAYYKAFSRSRGLVCKGDGIKADRTVNMAKMLGPDGVLPQIPNDAEHWPIVDSEAKAEDIARHGIICAGESCPQYIDKTCRRMMMLQFMLPVVPGLGIYQIDTGSINGILNIYGSLELIRAVAGRVSMIPLTLSIGPQKTTNPETGRAQTNNVLSLTCDFSLAKLQEYNRLAPGPDMSTRALPEPDDEVPTDLLPAEGSTEAAQPPTEQVSQPQATAKPTPRKPAGNRKLSEADKESLIAELRGTGASREEFDKAYAELKLGPWSSLTETGAAKLVKWAQEYHAASAAPPPAEEESGAPDLEGEQAEFATEEEQDAWVARVHAAHISEELLYSWLSEQGIDLDSEVLKADLSKANAWVAGFEDGSEGGASDMRSDETDEQQTEEHEEGAGEEREAPSEPEASAEEEAGPAMGAPQKGLEAAASELAPLAYEELSPEAREAEFLAQARPWAEQELGVEFDSDSDFMTRVLGMRLDEWFKLDGRFNDSFKRRVGRIKERGLA